MIRDQLQTFHRNADFVQALINHQVDFLVVGGMAVKAYRCRDAVDDLDLMLNPSDANVQRLLHALHCLKLNVPWPAERLSKSNVQIPFKRDFYLDVLTPPDGIDYESVKQRRETAHINNIPVYVVSRMDLIDLKRIALTRMENEIAKHQKTCSVYRQNNGSAPPNRSAFSRAVSHMT